MRIGHGYDVHRMVPGRKCILCGVEIPYEYGPDAHSDGDVALHALMDAVLGAAGLGDIGRWFPDNDDRWKGADSAELLREVCRMTGDRYVVGNCDITIVAQKPKIGPYVEEMRREIAVILGIPGDAVNVKATTEEGLGFTGRREGIAAQAVVLLEDRT